MKDYSPTAEEARQMDWSKEKYALMDRLLFIDFLEASNSPAYFTWDKLSDLVEKAEAAGMPFKVIQGRKYYHRNYSWNWLFYNLDSFYQPCSLGGHQAREVLGLTAKDRGEDTCCAEGKKARQPKLEMVNPRKVIWTVEHRLDLGEKRDAYPIVAGFPVPASVDSQTEIEFLGMWDGEKRLEPQVGKEFLVLNGFSVKGRPSICLRYAFRLVKSEIHAHGFPDKPKIPDISLPLAAFIDRLKSETPDAYSRAWGLYNWMLEHSLYFRGANPETEPEEITARYLERKGGDCLFLSRALIGFAAQVGLKIRPVYGPIAMHCDAADLRTQRFAMAGGSVMTHSWNEFEIPGVGWVPLDVTAVSFGGASMNERNCTDPAIRALFEREHRYQRYFLFGHSDSMRIEVTPRVVQIPSVLQVRPDAPNPPGALPFPHQKMWSCVRLSPDSENHG